MDNEVNNELMIKKPKMNIYLFLTIIFIVFFTIVLAMFIAIAVFNLNNDCIISGVYIKGVNVSGINKENAIYKVESELKEKMLDTIKLQHLEYETEISLEEIEANFDIKSAVNAAYNLGREGNIIQNTCEIAKILMINVDIEPSLDINEDLLNKALQNISTNLTDTVVQSGYYIDGNNLIITKGKSGNIVNIEYTDKIIKENIRNLNNKEKIELVVEKKEPDVIDIERIHNEIYKQPINAYYTANPFVVHPQENGIDFNISMNEAKVILEQEQEEYTIPLKYTVPEITTNMIGNEAFPDLISSFSTKYNASQTARTTNLRLASEKINGTVVMPGETFSYNTVVGERTIAAGYKDAKIYLNGEVVDGLGGGICQISTTLYNAALYANLEIVERRNHQFVTSYSPAGRDATVVYGSQDFKFKNNRNYPIKISCSVSGGIAKFELFGLREETEYEVEVTSSVTSRTATAIKSVTYRNLRLNGALIDSKIISRDTYKVH